MIDIGCGPATCGIAFAELFLQEAPGMVYTGIDVSAEMKRVGEHFLDDVLHGELHYQMLDSLSALDGTYWEGCSELPSLVIFNMSYFFSNVTAQFAERLAVQISEVMRKYPLNRYLFFVQHSEYDRALNSYKVFRRVLAPQTVVVRSENSSFCYRLNGSERTLPFCYDIFSVT